MTAQVDIFNLAVDTVGVDASISDVNENSREAELCRLHFPQVRDDVLRAANWSSAKAYRRLAVLKARDTSLAWAADDPEPGFAFAYQLPSDFLYPRFLSTYNRFVLGTYANDTALMTNEEQSILVYTFRQLDVNKWDQGLVRAISSGLGAAISMSLHGKTDRTQMALGLANQAIMTARVQSANEDNQTLEALPDWLTARGVGGLVFPNRFIYPVGPLLSMATLSV